MNEYAYVYILANGFKKLYIGITTELEIRMQQHKQKKDPDCHTARYNINRLVYFEWFTIIAAAIAREKQLKGWLRIRKLELIISTNPTWLHLSADWASLSSLPPDSLASKCEIHLDLLPLPSKESTKNGKDIPRRGRRSLPHPGEESRHHRLRLAGPRSRP